jgi:hypothetical protein
MLSQVVEAITYDVQRMYENGVSAMDISKYLQKKSLELSANYVR